MSLESTDHRWQWTPALSGVPLSHLIDEATKLQIGQLISLSQNARTSRLPCPDTRRLPARWFLELESLSLPQIVLVFCYTKNVLLLFPLRVSKVREASQTMRMALRGLRMVALLWMKQWFFTSPWKPSTPRKSWLCQQGQLKNKRTMSGDIP